MLLTRFLVFICSFLSTFSNSNGLVQSILDFIKFSSKPTKINLLLSCWKSNDINNLAKELSNNNILSRTITPAYNESSFVSKELELFLMDFDCYQTKNEDESESSVFTGKYDLLQFPHRWFIFINEISSFPGNLPLWINTRIYLFQRNKPQILTSPYLVFNTTSYRYNLIATWENDTYTGRLADILDYQNRTDQQGLVLNSTGVVIFKRTVDHLLDFRHVDEDSITKHNYLLLHHLMDILNATLNITWAPSWGTKALNSTRYNYMMGDLQSGVADIGGTIGFITKDRFEFVDFVANPVPTVGKFILRAPALSAVNNILTMPFEMDVWISTAVLTLIITGMMIVTMKLEWKFLQPTDADINILRPNAIDVVQFQIGVVCQQGIESEPRSLSGKIITFCALLSFLFFYTSYSACIVALLQSSSTTITTLEHLRHTNIKLAVDDMPYSKFFFSNQKGETKEAIFKEKITPANKPENFIPPAVGVEKIRTEFFAFHSERNNIYNVMSKTFQEHEKCGIVEIKFLSEIEPYMAIRKRLPYKEIITMAYARFKELGISMRVYKKTYSEKPKCTGSGGSFRSVGINDAYFAVMIYAIGATTAILIYVVEMALMKRQEGKLQKCV